MINKEILKKNLVYLKNKVPHLFNKILENLPVIENNLSIIPKTDDIDLIYKGQLYENLKKLSVEKLKRIYEDAGIVWTSHVLFEDVKKYYDENLLYNIDRIDVIKNTETLTIHGAFPFFHIKELLEKKEDFFPELAEIMIYDPNIEFIYILLSILDIRKLATEKRVNIFILTEEDRAIDYMGRAFLVFTINSYYFSYISEETKNLPKRLENLFRANLVDMNIKAIKNITEHAKINMKNPNNKYLLDSALLKVNSDFPIILVAPGPSLESHLEYLKKIQDYAIIVAVGTAIRPLIWGGIIPDFNIAIDAQKNLERFLEGIEEKLLQNIYLMSSLFITPEYIKPFKNNSSLVVKYRPLLNLLNVSNIAKSVNYFGSPTVSNTAFEIFATLGFKKILLFGMDFGTKYKDQRKLHAKGYLKDGETEEDIFDNARFLEVEGSLGGIVYAPQDFNASRLVLEEEIRFYRNYIKNLKVYNFSDGAKVEGTIPSHIEKLMSLISKDNKKKKKQIKKKIVQSFKKFDIYFDRNAIKKLRSLYPIFSSIKEKIFIALENEDYDLFCNNVKNLETLFSTNERILEFILNHHDYSKIKTIYRYVKPASEKYKNHKKHILKLSKEIITESLNNIDEVYINLINET